MSIAKHHYEWLSLLDISGPFLGLPVLLRVFPQGLEAHDAETSRVARLVFEEWLDNQRGLRPDPAMHTLWVRYVFERVLGYSEETIAEGLAMPPTVRITFAEHREMLQPDLILHEPGNPANPHLLVRVYPIGQNLDKLVAGHRWKASPAMRMMELLRATGVRLGLVTNGEQWMLIRALRGETTTFVSWYASLWFEEPLTLRAFRSLFGVTRFFSVQDEDSLEGMLADSVNEQQEVTDQLGYQVRRAVEVLIRSIDRADEERGRKLLTEISEAELYEAALTVMMRLVFLLSAEERGLLLLGDPLYDQHYAVSTLRAQLREAADQHGEEVLDRRFDAWCRLLATFRAIYSGIQHDQLRLPAYGGSLFDPDRFQFLEGRSDGLAPGEDEHPLPISNRTVLHLLEALQILKMHVPGGGKEPRRVSFRALDVEQIGHVYEGLLDHMAVRATEPVLGLGGSRDSEPEIVFSHLLAEQEKGLERFITYLADNTGRAENAIKRSLLAELDSFQIQNLKSVCGNDSQIYQQVLPFAGLIREDDFGMPVVILSGDVYVTAGVTRRATGTHYTPRSLTEPIVQHTLEPLVYIGPAEGLPREEWKLHSPAEILSLKVCDMAMGSAGFLVQADRYLAERLIEAWGIASGGGIQITPDGKPSKGLPGETLLPKDEDERMILARRLVADRCLYGVDKNPLAVEIAKLSLWLSTMAKGHPFTFLDHALKCGDSLVGVSADDYLRWAQGWSGSDPTLFDHQLQARLETARQKRGELESFEVKGVHDAERKIDLLKDANAAIEHIKRGCDLLAGTRLLGLSNLEIEKLQSTQLFPYMTGELDTEVDSKMHPNAARALDAAKREHAFHWELEFPEVFSKGGFDAFIGNPPFLGGWQIPTYLGASYSKSLRLFFDSSAGTADLVAYFYRKCFELLSNHGCFGLIATKSISESDTRAFSLDEILNNRGVIYHADVSLPWPGEASVIITVLHITKAPWNGNIYLNGVIVDNLTSSLNEELDFSSSRRLGHKIDYSQGTALYGGAFIRNISELSELLRWSPGLLPYLKTFVNGDILNGTPDNNGGLIVVDFGEKNREEIEGCETILNELSELVSMERENQTGQIHETRPWLHWDKRTEFYTRARQLDRVLACTIVSTNLAFVFSDPRTRLYSHGIKLFADSRFGLFALLQSSIHNVWARATSSTLGRSIRYSTSTTFDKFPWENEYIASVEEIGQKYHSTRAGIMLARQEGLTATYNRFHNPKDSAEDIVHLRKLHAEMDHAVAAAYSWTELHLDHDFHKTAQGIRYTISEVARSEVLSRLLKLNHEQHQRELRAGLYEKKKEGKKKGKKNKANEGQDGLL